MNDHDVPELDLSEVFRNDVLGLSSTTTQFPSPDDLPSSPDETYTVQMLQREISNLLESAVDLPHHETSAPKLVHSDETYSASNHVDPGFGSDLNFAAVLQAAHAAQTRDFRSTIAADPVGVENARETTRVAPTFHSLMAEAGTTTDLPKATRYIYREDGENDGDGDDEYQEETRRHATPPTTQVSSSPILGPEQFHDFDDILNQLSDLDRRVEHTSPFSTDFTATEDSSLPFFDFPPPSSTLDDVSPTAEEIQAEAAANKAPASDKPSTNSHTCELCNKSFTRRSDLTRHTRIHTGERPFACTHHGCNKTFIQRSALHVHIRVHTGERPHCCEYPGCGKWFGDSSSLARHRRTHTGKRPYKCDDAGCDKTFTRRSTLNLHMRSHDPSWESNPKAFKAKKKRRTDNTEELDELEQSTDPLTNLLNSEEPDYASGHDTDSVANPLQGLGLGGPEEEEEEDELIHDGANNDLPPITTLRDPPTSTDNTSEASSPLPDQAPFGLPPPPIQVEDDLFTIPLRARKVPVSAKRKR